MTHPQHTGEGIGKMMGEFSLIEAKKLGYISMQFNMVVKTNVNTVRLWKKLGFKIIGEIPGAFDHPKEGLINSCIMWREL